MNEVKKTGSGAIDTQHYMQEAQDLRAQTLKRLLIRCRTTLQNTIRRDTGEQNAYRSPGDCAG